MIGPHLLLLLAACPSWVQVRPLEHSAGVVLVARSRAGDEVWLGGEQGLSLCRHGGETVDLGRGHSPRFTARGALAFERDRDDGLRLLRSETWVLEPGRSAPRRALPGEVLPDYVPPASVRDVWSGAAVRICVDAGHGGSDPGAVGIAGLLEKDVNLDVALILADLLVKDTQDASGGGAWEVLLTRSTDVTVSLGERVNLANAWPADRFVSIHSNAFGSPAAQGTETYSFQDGTVAADLRDEIQAEMLAAWGLVDRGVKTASFFVLVNTTMPATLSELGFVTSPVDSLLLADPADRAAAARAHLFALQRHFGIAPHDPVVPPLVYCTAKTSSLGCEPRIVTQGIPTATDTGAFVIRALDALPAQGGVLVYGFEPSGLGFHGGTLCVKAPITRWLPVKVSKSGGAAPCTGVLRRDFNARIRSGVDPLLTSGQRVHAQWIQRDPGDPAGFGDSLSDAVEFLICP